MDFNTYINAAENLFMPKSPSIAEIAARSVTDWLAAHSGQMERVIFTVFKDEDKKLYEKLLTR